MSRFLQKLEHCTGENAEVLHDHLKQSRLKLKGFGIDPKSREVVTVVVSSFLGQCSNWVANIATEIFNLDSIDSTPVSVFLTKTWRVRICILLLNYINLISPFMSIHMSLIALTLIGQTTSRLRLPRTCTLEVLKTSPTSRFSD